MLLEALRADARLAEWLRDLESEGAPRLEAVLPDEDELPDLLLDLTVPTSTSTNSSRCAAGWRPTRRR